MDNHRKAIEKILDRINKRPQIPQDLDTIRHCTHALAFALISAAEIIAETHNDKSLGGELDRMRSRLTQAYLKIDRLEKL